MNKLNLILKSGETLFHTQDLALLWEIENRNTLYTTIKRYVKQGVLVAVTRGLYSTIPVAEIDKFKLGSALIHKYSYVSCETVLAQTGVINQAVYPIIFVTSVSLRLKFGETQYIYRQLRPEILFDPNGVESKDGYFMATKERAISDMLYFNPKYYFDNIPK
jgi:predicted transcriptional regulator of viral defense system